MNIIKIKNGVSEHFTVICFPDGQQTIQLDLEKLNVKKPIDIVIRATGWKDIEVLLCALSALRNNDFYVKSVHFVYLFGMRSDRAFAPGQPNYVRDVLAPIIKSMNVQVSLDSPHSEIICKYLKAYDLSDFIYNVSGQLCEKENAIFIAGDESTDRWDLTSLLDNPEWHFTKCRNEHGQITSLQLSNIFTANIKGHLEDDITRPIVIYDDLCDGGATFIAEVQLLRDLGFKNPLYLVVAHGIFSKGFDDLFKYFARIYTTNSYRDFPNADCETVDVERLIVKEVI